ncbi:MAG: DUF6427 family protein [Cyclobacteriaceae bacterium]|nr:DUF6427 family protein [Cyclobacteriaceae bacterium]
MFQLFRVNDPYRLFLVLVILFVLRLSLWIADIPLTGMELKWLVLGERLGDGFLMYKESYDYTAPFSAMVYKILDIITGKRVLVHQFVGSVILFLNAVLFNILLLRNKAFTENNYLPALLYVLFACVTPGAMVLSPQLMSSTFILLALNNVLRRVDNEATDELFIYAGLYIGVSVLFYAPSIVYSLLFLVALLVFSTAIGRRLVLYLFGLLLPLMIAASYYYWVGSFSYFIDSFWIRGLIGSRTWHLSVPVFFISSSLPMFWFVVSLLHTVIFGRFGNYETRIIQIFFLFGVAVFLSFLLDVDFSSTQMIFFVPVSAFFTTHFILNLSHRLLGKVLPWLITIPTLLFPFVIGNYLDYSSLYVKPEQVVWEGEDQSIMLIGYPVDAYLGQSIAGPFIDPELSEYGDTYLDLYEKAADMYTSIDRKRPDMIMDQVGMMEKMFHRFPLLEREYEQAGPGRYVRIKSN